MSYRVHYAKDMNKNLTRKNNLKFLRYGVAIIILLIIVGIQPLQKNLYESIIPANYEFTVNCFSDMLNDLENGESVSRAVTTFCRAIIENA